MNPELPKLESKREELLADIATAKILGNITDVNKYSRLLCQCEQKIMKARVSDEVKRLNNE